MSQTRYTFHISFLNLLNELTDFKCIGDSLFARYFARCSHFCPGMPKIVETIGKESVCPSIKEMFMVQKWAYRKEKKLMMREKL